MLTIILGPGTRLAKALLSSQDAQHEVVLMAPDEQEAEWLASAYPEATMAKAREEVGHLPAESEAVHVFCCALGPIHPDAPRPGTDAETMVRDLDLVERLLAHYSGVAVNFVFVSSVLALSPRRGRVYYGGWKCVAEAALEACLARRERALLSVVYPGRLVGEGPGKSPFDCVHTRYEKLAARMREIALTGKPVRRIIGVDARLLMIVRGVASWVAALSGRR